MKTGFKLLLSSISTIGLISGIYFSASAENFPPQLTMKGSYAEENTVTSVTASFDGEISLAAFSVSISFDPDQLEFVSACSNIGYGSFFFNSTSEDAVTFIWSDSKNQTLSGDIFNIEFKVKSDTAGQTIPINIVHSVMGSESMEEITFDASGCEISVLDNYMWGDANNDGKLSISDVAAINKFNIDNKKYALTEEMIINADADNNNIINSDDSKVILKYLKTKSQEENLYE